MLVTMVYHVHVPIEWPSNSHIVGPRTNVVSVKSCCLLFCFTIKGHFPGVQPPKSKWGVGGSRLAHSKLSKVMGKAMVKQN